ncbi:MAG TPA: hypothetical protein VJ861_13235 [Treponemataceae bacterium]|nr:hypothetical protein [Treponemataceae bacterium]
MTEEILIRLVEQAQENGDKTSMDMAISALGAFLYTRLHQYRLEFLDEDSRSDFIVWIYPRFDRFISRFNPEKASFRTYLHWMVKLSYNTFIKDRYTKMMRQRIMEIEESTRLLSIDAEKNNTHDWSSFSSENEIDYSKNRKKEPEIMQVKKNEEIYARRILLLACKSGYFLDDAAISKVALRTKTDEIWLRERLDEIKIHCKDRYKKIHDEAEKRNNYYIRAQKCQYEMQKVTKESPRYTRLQNEYDYCNKQWQQLKEKSSKHIIGPSNRFLSKTLGIKRGTIDSTLANIRHPRYSDET